MYKRTLSILLFFLPLFVFGQDILVDTTYYQGSEVLEDLSDSAFTTFEVCEVDKKGRRIGSCNRFSRSGKMVEYSHYEKGELNGEYVRFSPLETPIIKGWYFEGRKDGAWLTYDVSGKPLRITIYNEDEEFISRDPFIVGEADTLGIDVVDEARYPGGDEGWMEFLKFNLEYPLWAKRYGIEGQVFLEALITKEGLIAEVIITESPAEILSNEAIRVVRKSSPWEPKRVNGEPVDTYQKLMFTFRLKN